MARRPDAAPRPPRPAPGRGYRRASSSPAPFSSAERLSRRNIQPGKAAARASVAVSHVNHGRAAAWDVYGMESIGGRYGPAAPPGWRPRVAACRPPNAPARRVAPRLLHPEFREPSRRRIAQPRGELAAGGGARHNQDAQARALLEHLELAYLAVARHDPKLGGMHRHLAAAGRETQDVVAAPLDRPRTDERAAACARLRLDRDGVGQLQPNDRLHEIVEEADEQPRPRLAGWHRLTFGVHILEERRVLEEVDAFVALAFDAPQSLGRGVEVEWVYAESLHEPFGHLRRAQLAAGGHHREREAQTSGELLFGQPHRHGGVGVQELGPEAVELFHHPIYGQREGQPQKAVDADTEGGGALPAHVRGGHAPYEGHPEAAREPGFNLHPGALTQEHGNDSPP